MSRNILEPNVEVSVKEEQIDLTVPTVLRVNNVDSVCRICLFKLEYANSVNIFTNIYQSQKLDDLIKAIASVEVLEDDLLSKVICNLCATKLGDYWKFRQMIIDSDIQQRQQIEYARIVEEEEIKQKSKKWELKNVDFDLSETNCTDYSSDNATDNDKNFETDQKDNIACEVATQKHDYTCKVCSKKLKNKINYMKHMQTHDNTIKCEYCPRTFAALWQMKNHRRIHLFDRPFKCSDCGKSFRFQTALNIHQKNHYKLPNHKCDECGLHFRVREALERHKNKHENKKPYMCEICSKCFPGKDNLYHHKSSHRNDALPCPQCDKTFGSKMRLRVHLRTHLGLKVVCEVCAKELSSKKALREHMKIHNGIKDHACQICGKCFTQSSVLVRHMRVHSGERPFKCGFCEKDFPFAQHLRSHMSKYHPECANKETVKESENATSIKEEHMSTLC